MMYHGYDSYGYQQPEEFKTFAEIEKLQYKEIKMANVNPCGLNATRCECGQETGDLVEVKD